ncbi:hypothetical protein [Mammaliicoccus sp. P-M55]|uniref:hypothetical protein n=1 Tax=Mammaliicoccus sp. P-M55 TaxID=2898714 RepID=UPI001EFC1DDB|nr:hypothetical protein [Mammaliicoccus sp. P-M55]
MQHKFKCLSAFIILICLVSGCSNDSTTKKETQQKSETKQAKAEEIQVSDKEKEELKEKLLIYADQYGKDKGMAISNRYFSSSDHTQGDGYALTEDGELQITNHNKPGKKAFKVHNIVGISAYYSKNNVKGIDKQAQDLTNIQGYNEVADMNKPITKYLFADNGKVYQYEFTQNEDVTLSTGFADKDYNGKDPNLKPNVAFTEVKDKDIVQKWKKLLSKYKS